MTWHLSLGAKGEKEKVLGRGVGGNEGGAAYVDYAGRPSWGSGQCAESGSEKQGARDRLGNGS